MQNHLFSGQALPLPSQPYEQTSVTVTPWHLHSPVLHHSHPPHHSRVFVLTFPNIRVSFNYLFVVDRYSNWPIIERGHDGSKGQIDCLRYTFVTFGIPDKCATDGGSEFTAATTQQFLKDWGVHHRLSSLALPHSNCRADIGVKTAHHQQHRFTWESSTQMHHNEPYFSIVTFLTPTQSSLLPSASLADQSKIHPHLTRPLQTPPYLE